MANLKTSISFGLVNIPIVINPVIKNNDTAFNQLHKKCKHRIKYLKYCPVCKVQVKQKDIVRGYEYQKDDYVILTDEEFERLKTEDEKTIEIIAFVKLSEIDPIYFEKSYVINIEKKMKAYTLFKEALKKSKKVALAKTIIGTKFYYVILRLGEERIIMTTLYFDEEIHLGNLEEPSKITEKELDLALKLIDGLSAEFEPQKYIDEYQTKVKKALNEKIKGTEIKPVKSKKKKTITNLMEALEASLKA